MATGEEEEENLGRKKEVRNIADDFMGYDYYDAYDTTVI